MKLSHLFKSVLPNRSQTHMTTKEVNMVVKLIRQVCRVGICGSGRVKMGWFCHTGSLSLLDCKVSMN